MQTYFSVHLPYAEHYDLLPLPLTFFHSKHTCAECYISCLTTNNKPQLLLSFHVHLLQQQL